MLSVTHEFHRLKRTHITNTRRCWTEMCFKQKRHSLTQSDGPKEKNKKEEVLVNVDEPRSRKSGRGSFKEC